MKKAYLILSILMLVFLTGCGVKTVTPTEATLPPSATQQKDTFVVSTEKVEETQENEKPTEGNGVSVSENVTVERNESNTNQSSSNSSSNSNSGGSSSGSTTPTSKPATATQSNKVWHNAVYKTVEHPAETKEVWVVDKEAYTEEVPTYSETEVIICDTCGADITSGVESHHHESDFTYHTETKNVITGYESVNVPEQGHYETVVVKEAYTEKILIKEAGYY